NLDFIYLCYDNEGYGNTGQQYSSATPHAALTATSRTSHGYPGYKKDLFSIWAAHRPAFVATVIGAEPLDLAQKVEALQGLQGPRLLIGLAPCPTGWGFDPSLTVKIGRLAVETGIWPLKEYRDDRTVHTRIVRHRKPVEEYLQLQDRFRHLFEPERNNREIALIQARIDQYWSKAIDADT
ncbi:MAG: pyruvate synthase, partial [Deltaproteobacteria bacterium]|nr:pyruvate synthase [Deltaproteobacteria bacterium]